MALERACGGDVLTTTISRGSDPSTIPLTVGILGYHFSAFWLSVSEGLFVVFSLFANQVLSTRRGGTATILSFVF